MQLPQIQHPGLFRCFVRWMLVALASLAMVSGCAASGAARPTSSVKSPASVRPGATLAPLLDDLRDEGEVPGWRKGSRRSFTAPAGGFARQMGRTLGRPVRESTTSPDGRHVAFIVGKSEGQARGEIWIARADGSLPYVVHPGLDRARQPEWRTADTAAGRIHFASRGRVWSFRPVLLED